ncbi:hypothetical protein JXL83_08520 [candidate division WOR-3 bacterium]|nr:hypothetical protein [candidate division WOR-3 bacterium]
MSKIIFVFFSSFLLLCSPSLLFSALIFSSVAIFLSLSGSIKKALHPLFGTLVFIVLHNMGFPAKPEVWKLISMLYFSFFFAGIFSVDDLLSLPFTGKSAIMKSLYMICEISSSFAPFIRSELKGAVLTVKINGQKIPGSMTLFPMLANWSVLKIEHRKRDLFLSLSSRGFRDTDDLNFPGKTVLFRLGDTLLYSFIILFSSWRFLF